MMQEEGLESLACGLLLGGYEATRFKAKAKNSELSSVIVHTSANNADKLLQSGVAFGKGTLLARSATRPYNIHWPFGRSFQKAPERSFLMIIKYYQLHTTLCTLYTG